MDVNQPICRTANGPGLVSFRRHLAPPEIRTIVESIWTFSADLRGGDLTDCILPDVGSEIICRIDAEPCIFLRGPQLQVEEIAIPPGARYLGARLRPGAAAWFFGLPAADICRARVPIEAMAMRPSDIGGSDAAGDAARLAQALAGVLGRRHSALRPTIGMAAAELIHRKHGKISADAVASALGCSTRHLRREMIAAIGMGPKTVARIARLRRAVGLLGSPDHTLVQVALDAGYGDQAHMTREFAALKAPSPARLRRWRESDFGNTPEPLLQ